jgi:hypothetical protein
MEARQNFGVPIDLTRCASIRVEIRNGDHYPSMIGLELILTNTTQAGKPSISLGQTQVKSRLEASAHDAVTEALVFEVPAAASLREFDEAILRFHLARLHATRSARISIERFVLVPRS